MSRPLLIGMLFICMLLSTCQLLAQAGTPVDEATLSEVLKKCEVKFPKFYREYNYIKVNDSLIKSIVFVRYANGGDNVNGPAKAGPRGNVFIDVKYLENKQPDFPDDRLVVVLYHEIGHLHYFATVPAGNRNPDESEQSAFEYSLKKAKELAEQGDCEPLKTGLKFMKRRSEANNMQDPHVRALKKMVSEPLYNDYIQWVKQKCK